MTHPVPPTPVSPRLFDADQRESEALHIDPRIVTRAGADLLIAIRSMDRVQAAAAGLSWATRAQAARAPRATEDPTISAASAEAPFECRLFYQDGRVLLNGEEIPVEQVAIGGAS